MKIKTILTALLTAIMFGVSAKAAIIDVVYSTDIGVVIDGQPIQAYNIDGNMYVIAENLRSYGFDVVWNDVDRTLKINRNGQLAKTSLTTDEINIKKADMPVHQRLYDVYSTDIKTYVADSEVEAKSIDGETMIKVRELGKYGIVDYNDERRLATVEISKPCLEWDFENAQKQELVIDDDTTYTGQVKDGVPYGVGIMKHIDRDQELKKNTRPMPQEFAPWLLRETYDTVDLITQKLGYFVDGKPVGVIYTSQDIRQSVIYNPQQVKDYVFKSIRLEYYIDNEVAYGSDTVTGSEQGFYDDKRSKLDDGTSWKREDNYYISDEQITYKLWQDKEYVYCLQISK